MPSKPDTSKDEQFKKLWATDMTIKLIRERLGISECRATDMKKRLNLPDKKGAINWR